MPKKRGEKESGSKQVAMTEEERLVYLQQKAQAEEESARKKEDMLTQFLKDKLEKEERNSAINQHKLTQQWRTILRQTRSAELRNDISVLSQTFERVFDCHDSVIRALVSDLSEAEQQSASASRAHLQCLDRLLDLQKERVAGVALQWNKSLKELSSEYNTERDQILMQHQVEHAYLKNVTSALDQQYAEINNEAEQEFYSSRDEIKHQHNEEKHALQLQLAGTIKELLCQYQHEQQSYKEALKVQDSLQHRAQMKDQKLDQQMSRLKKIQDSINALQNQLSSSQKDSEEFALELRKGQEQVTHKTQQLRAKIREHQAAERMKLTKLTVQSNNAIKNLQNIVGKAERLLRKAELCRKLETEQEKVLPFYKSSLSAEELSQASEFVMEPPSEELAQVMQDYTGLENFLQRYNKVLLDKLCIKREKAVLQEKNKQLRFSLKQYMDGISVNDRILQQQNPLLMVSQPTPQSSSSSEIQKHHTVIEAAHVVKHIV